MPKWEKGQSGNPAGRKANPIYEELRAAIKEVEKKQGKRLLVHMVETAYKDNFVMVALGKKLLPDLKALDSSILLQGILGLGYMTDAQLNDAIVQMENGNFVTPKNGAKVNGSNGARKNDQGAEGKTLRPKTRKVNPGI